MTMTWTSICTIRNCSDRVTIVARDARRGMGLRSDPVRDGHAEGLIAKFAFVAKLKL